jgi:hypothetical protein
LFHILEREGLENDLVHGDSGFADRVQRQHQRMRRADFVVPICADDQEVFNIGMTEEMFDETQSRNIQPLKVIEKKGQRMFSLSKDVKEPSEHRLLPILRFLRWELWNGRLSTDDQFKLGDKVGDELPVRRDSLPDLLPPKVHLVLALAQNLAD